MVASDEQPKTDWWASDDTPVRNDSRVTYFVDGRTAMLMMCLHFLKARRYIYLANWGMTPGMEMVRGKDHRAGPDGSSEEENLLAWLRVEGLSEADIAFWSTHDLSVQAVLGYAVSKGVEVKVLLWHSFSALGLFTSYDPEKAHQQLTEAGITCLLDDSARGLLHHPIESLHQKISVVDGSHAFVGGVDLMIEINGDFDRWDTPAHAFSSPLRSTKEGTSPHPWHDAHTLIEGPAVGDVELNFRQRWNDVVERFHRRGSHLLIPEHPLAEPLESKSLVQVARTIPEHTYSFDAKTGIQGIAQLYSHALDNVQHWIYLENQYFWLHAFSGVDIPLLGSDSPDMEANIRKLGQALRHGASVAMILPDHPHPGRAFTDAGVKRLYDEAPEAVTEGRLQIFCLGAYTSEEDGEHYRPIYVHAKVAIVDDLWSTAGSANLNNRGMRDDTEMNVATLDAELARGLRLMLWAEHLGLLDEDDLFIVSRYLGHQYQGKEEQARAEHVYQQVQQTIGDAQTGLHMMAERARDNLRRYQAKQPLVGHLLPYLLKDQAISAGLAFHEEHGWLEERSA